MITVDVEGKQVEFPDGTNPSVIEGAIKTHFYPQNKPASTSQILKAPDKEYTTGLGHILNAVGWPEERMKAVLSEPRRALKMGKEMGMYSPKPMEEIEAENRILGTVGSAVSSMIPYKSSVTNAVMGGINWRNHPKLVADAKLAAKKAGVRVDNLEYVGLQSFQPMSNDAMHLWNVKDPKSPQFESTIAGPTFQLKPKGNLEIGTSVSVRGKQGVINEVNPDGTVSVGFKDGSMAEVGMNEITVGTERRAVK